MVTLAALLLAVPLVAVSQPASAQPDQLKTLQKEVEDLKAGQARLRQELQELKSLLRQREAASRVRPVDVVLDLRDAPSKGDRSARVTLVEFADYECPFCARHFYTTLPQLERDYIRTGKLRYVFRDFPLLSIHKEAMRAAEAANCAGERGKFWEMHDRLFADPKNLGTSGLRLHAEAVGLDAREFERCLATGNFTAKIQRDMADGQKAGVRGTPTFFVGLTEADGQTVKAATMLVGAQPYAVFREAIEGLLSASR